MKSFILQIKSFTENMKRQNISAFSASIAFFFFLSFVPMLMVICTIIPYTPLTRENLLVVATQIVPEKIAPLAEGMIEQVYEKSAGILSFAIIATLWSAGKGMLALMRGLNAINHVEEKRNYFLVRVIASFYTFFMLIVTLLSLLFMVFGEKILNKALLKIPELRFLVNFLVDFRFLAVWLILTMVFSAIYAYVPNKKLHFREQIPGASFTAMVWSVFSWAFSLYVEWADYSIYGNLSIIILVMLWMYCCMYIMMIGAYLNRYFAPLNKVLFKKHRKESQRLDIFTKNH